MSSNNGLPVYTALDEQRFALWMNRLEDSFKNYVDVSSSEGDASKKEELLAGIKNAIKNDLEKYPQWIASQKTVPASKIASSSNDVKTFLRHIAFPHVLTSYHNIVKEICPDIVLPAEIEVSDSALSEAAESVVSTEDTVEMAVDAAAAETTAAPVSTAVTQRQASSTLNVPMHTAPIVALPGVKVTAVEDFFRGLSRGHGDGLVNLCKLADINHRINRACEHDTHQVSQWVENEQTRRDGHSSSLEQRRVRLQQLRGDDERGVIQQGVVKLKAEIAVLGKALTAAEREEEEARRIYEAAIMRRKQATQNIVNLESYIDNVAVQRDLLRKVNELRVEADKYNIASAESRVVMFQGLERYVQSVQEQFVRRRLGEEMPQLFANLVSVFGQIFTPAAKEETKQIEDSATSTSPAESNEKLSLFCAARVGLETIRIWQQLNLHVVQPALVDPIGQFQGMLKSALAGQKLPSITDPDAASVYKANNSTVVLFFDHLAHDTPEDHVEANSRVLTCLKMLTEHLQDEWSAMEVDENFLAAKGRRSMQLLNCNDVLSPPVWCLPLAHSPQYLAQLWRLAEEAHHNDLYVPLEFDTEWVSEDPYHTSSDEEDGGRRRSRTSSSTTANLMHSVDFDAPWANAMDEAQRAEFTKLLTPVSSDHLVAKVIKRMDARSAARASRGGVKLPVGRPRNEDRNPPVASQSTSSSSTKTAAVSERVVPVRTSMGPGTVLQNYRRDGLVSVTLQWGAVGHFSKESVQFVDPPVMADPRKPERESYSAAQAFYVNGSGGRFVHNDMELHNTMARLVSLVRVQRIIGDFVVINHANLSLYMHGRTSSGLTKTIEATIAKWVNKFDKTKLSDLLDFAEQSNARGATVEPQEFLRMLEKTSLQYGQSGASSASTTTSGSGSGSSSGGANASASAASHQAATASAFESLPDDAEEEENDETASNTSTSKSKSAAASQRSTSASSGLGLPHSSSTQSISSALEQSAITPKKETRTKTHTDVRTLAKYSKDGETLRELMLNIMRNLRISQGSIANEYYRNFRYETSQGGVSAWFHFRGNSSTFDAMNHCAMMWAEDHKDQLGAEEQRVLGEVCRRMSQVQHAHGNSHAMPTHHASASSAKPSPKEIGIPSVNVSSGDLVTEGGSSKNGAEASDGDATPIGLILHAAETIAATGTGNTVSSDEGGEDMTMDEDATGGDSAESVDDAAQINEAAEMIVQQTSSAKPKISPERPPMVAVSIADLLSSAPLRAHSSEAPTAAALVSSSTSTAVPATTSDAMEVETEAPAEGATEVKMEIKKEDIIEDYFTEGPLSPARATPPAAPAAAATPAVVPATPPPPAKVEEIRTIADLHRTVVFEMNRRKVSQSKAAVEANLRELGMGQPALSKFLSVASINNNDRGKLFSEYMVKWVKYSQQQSSTSDWNPETAPTYRAPRPSGPTAANATTHRAPAPAPAAPRPTTVSAYTAAAKPSEESEEEDEEEVEAEIKEEEVVMEEKMEEGTDAASLKEADEEVDGAEEEEEQPATTDDYLPPKGIKTESSSSGQRSAERVLEEDELTCGLCGKMSTEFASNKSFHMHLAWCYRRKNQSRPPPDHMLKTGATGSSAAASADWVANASNVHRKRKSVGSDDPNKRAKASDFKPHGSELTKDTYVISADSIKLGHHYDSCEMCKDHGEVLRCASCPCIYHPRCADVSEVPEGKWNCPKCVETGASVGEIVSDEMKSNPAFADSWILVYSDALHRWRKSVVLEVHPTRPGVVLVKWWRIDNKGGKTNWLDLSNSTILTAAAERLGMPPSRSRNSLGSSAATVTPAARERQQTVRFESESFERKKSSNNSRFRDDHSMIFMDGENGGSVPPLVRAAAAGIGGVSALRDGEYEEKTGTGNLSISGSGMSDTYLSSNSLKAALCASGSACRAVDIAVCNENTNVFVCSRPPGHHAGRYGCTGGCLSTGFCLLNNAAIAAIYGRVRWGLERVAVVDIDVHFGNGTAELLRNDPNAFFASVHMIYGEDNDGLKAENDKRIDVDSDGKPRSKPRASSSGFYPARMGLTEVTDTYVSVGVYPTAESSSRSRGAGGGAPRRRPKTAVPSEESGESSESEAEAEVAEGEGEPMDQDGDAAASGAAKPLAPKPISINGKSSSASNRALVGSEGFLKALSEVIIPQMEKFRPQLLVISAGFDGYVSDPLGGQLCLSLEDYKVATKMLMASMARIKASEPDPTLITGKVISLLEGGYDTSPFTLGLAKCVDAHVHALQEG